MLNLQAKIGLGIDIVDVNRFEKIPYKANRDFYKKMFDTSEIEYCLKFKDPAKHFAAKFAVKEAVKKSIKEKVSLLKIVTSHVRSRPQVQIKGKDRYEFMVSISHEAKIAVAIVISQKIR